MRTALQLRFVLFVLLIVAPLAAQTTPPAAAPDAQATALLQQMQIVASNANSNVAALRIDKWRTDANVRKQAESVALSIRRNLTYAVPELVSKMQAEPASLSTNFRMYRNLVALYDTFSELTESAASFAPREQYTPLGTSLTQLDQLRHSFADRIDQMAGANDAELARLRAAHPPAAVSKSATKTVVDDNQPVKKKPKPPATPQQ